MAKGKNFLAGREGPTDSLTMEEQEDSVKEAGGTLEPPVQPAMFEKPVEQKESEGPETPQVVRDNKMLMKYLRPEFDLNKEDTKQVGFELSLSLVEQHRGLLPEKVEKAWNYLVQSENKSITLIIDDQQTVEFFLDPKDKKPVLRIVAARLSSASIAIVEQSGSGDAIKTVRFKFVAWTDLSQENDQFACWKFNESWWIKMLPTQSKLL